MSTGFVLNIPQEMLNRLEDADKKIEKLAKTSEDAQTRIVSAFKSINTHGIDAFINKLTEAQTKLSQLGSTQINMGVNANAFSGLVTQAQNAIDEVNRVVTAISKVKRASGETGMAKNPFAGMSESLKQWNNLQSQIDAADAKIKKLASTTMDYERQMQRMRSGQTTPMNISYNEYAYTKERIAALQEEKRVLQEKQAEITRQNNALSEQVRIQESLKRFVANQDSLPNRRSRDDYENLRRQLAEEEKASEKAEKKRVKDVEKSEKEAAKIREAERKKREKEEKATADRIAAYDSKARRERYKAYTTTYEGAMRTSDRAKTLLQEQQAIKNLEAARAKLNKTDSDYANKLRNLNQRIIEHKNNIDKATAGSKNLQKQHRSLMDISGQLARRLALVFSVSQITGYVKKLIEVRGEFELQQRSLQAILQNKDEANRIWQQTVDLAVRSPFRVKELVSYTKQLAAYRIESDKLFETNKMLADISAGLGVDMQRLILAFGQVRSAAYLRGTELRQFTEAGIPILEQLAQYFTELEGRAVSVGDVFERVSKRMVSFADVEEIFRRMTSEGGTFYRMQEIQAETLQGQISNLKDSVDIMLNEIGKAYEGTLKNSISFVRSLIENWDSLANTLKVVVAAFAMTKLNALLAKESVMLLAIDMGILTNASQKQLTVTQLLSVGWNSFTKSIKNAAKGMKDFVVANPKVAAVLLLVSAFWKVGKAAWDFRNTLKEIDKQYASIADKQASAFVGFRNALNDGDLQKQKAALSNLINLANNEYNMEVKIDITGLSEEELNEEFNKLRQKLIEANAFASEFAKEQERSNQRDKWWSMSAFLGWDDDMFEDIDDMGDAYTKLNNRMVNMLPSTINMLQERFDSLSESQKELLKSLNTPIKKDESLVDYFNRLKNAFESLSEEGFVDDNKFNRFFRQFERSSRRAKEEFDAFIESFKDEAMSIADKDERTFFLDIAIDKYSSEKNWSEFEENQIRKWIEDAYNIKFNMVMADGSQTLEPWADRVYGAISKINDEIKKKSEGVSDADLFPLPKVGQTKEAYLALAKEVIGIAEMTYNETQQIEDESMVNRTKALAPYADEVRKILNLYKETTKDGGDKDTFTPMLRTVKEIYQEFKKLQGSFDDLTAKEGALAKFGDAFKEAFGKTPEQMGFDLFSEEGVKAAYDYLISKAPDAKKKIQAQLAKGEIVWDVKLQKKKDTDKELLGDIQNMFDQYDLSLELKKLNIPPDLAKSLFDVDYLDLEGLKAAVQEQESKFIGTDMEDEYKKFLEKIDDMEDKAAKERMKTYVKYLMEGMSERVKLKIEEMRKLKEIEESDKFTPEQKERIKEGVSKEARAEQQKQEWKDFQGTEMYTMMFEDLEHYGTAAIEMLYTKLSELKTSLSDLPASEVKEIVGQIEKLENIQIERNPFESLKKYKDEVKNIGFTEDELQTQLLDSQKAEEDAQKYIDIYNTVMQSLMSEDEGVFEEIDAETLSQWNQMLRLAEEQGKTVEEILADRKETVETEQENQGKIVKNLNSYKKLSKAQRESLELTQEWLTQVGNLFSSSKELMESLGVESDSVAMTIADTGSSMVSLIGSAIQFTLQLDLMGVAANNALGIIGWIAIALQAVATVLSAIFSAKDKALQKEIDGHLARAEKLHEKYEELSDAIDSAYDASVVRQLNKEIEKTIKLEIKAIEAAIAAEKAQKASKIDWDWVDEQEKAVKDLYGTLNEEHDNYIERWGGFGSEEARFDFIESMTQAWLDSFKETGDGLAGLEDKWDEYFDNLAMKQMALRVSKAAIDQYLDMWDKYVSAESAGGEDLTEAEAQDLRLKKEQLLKELSEKYTSLAESLGITPTKEGSGLSALSKSIQGVSESTAQVLESLLSSMRFYVADSNSKLGLLLQSMGVSTIENPQLVELRTQTMVLNEINAKIASLNETVGGLIVNDRLKVTATTQLDQLIRPRANGGVGLNIVND